jgi:hypothetical protein
VFDGVIQQYKRILEGNSDDHLRINVYNCHDLGRTIPPCIHCRPVFRAAPTGIAAFNIQGRAIHSLLRLPIKKGFEGFKPPPLAGAQAKLK